MYILTTLKSFLHRHLIKVPCLSQCQEIIEGSYMIAKGIADDVDFHGCLFNEFGKGLIKKCRTSPDAFIQLALQLAHYRVQATHIYIKSLCKKCVCILWTNHLMKFVGAGQGWILSDLRIIHDAHVPRGPDGNRTLVHLWVHGICKSNGGRKHHGESNTFTDPTQGSALFEYKLWKSVLILTFFQTYIDLSAFFLVYQNEQRLLLFKKAADKHQNMYRLAMTGAGIDRHLFCLYIVSKVMNIDSPFLKQVCKSLFTEYPPYSLT